MYKNFALSQSITAIITICSISLSYADIDLSQYTDISANTNNNLLIYNEAKVTSGKRVQDITVESAKRLYFTADGTKDPASSYGKGITVNQNGFLSIGGSRVDDLTFNSGYAYITASEGISSGVVIWRLDSEINNTKINGIDGNNWGIVDLLHNSVANDTTIDSYGWLQVNRLNDDPNDRTTANNNLVKDNGVVTVYNRGIITDTNVEGGFVQLYDGAASYKKLDVSSGIVEMTAADEGVYAEHTNLQNSNTTLNLIFDITPSDEPGSEVPRAVVTIDNLNNEGEINYQNNYGTLQSKNVTGSGIFNMRVAGMMGDFLNITDSITGNFMVAVEDTGTEPDRSSEGYHLIHAKGSVSDTFKLVNGAVDLGAYQYYLNQQGHDWYLSTRARRASNATRAVMAMSNVLPTVWDGELMTLRGRMGEIRQTKGNGGVWVRSLNNRYHVSGTDAANYTQNMNGMMVGADTVLDVKHGHLILGALASYSRSDIDFKYAGGGDVDSYGVGGYATWLLDNGYYIDSVIKLNRYDVTTDARTHNGSKAKGDYRTTGLGASIEAGKTIRVDNLFIEPYLKLSAFNAGSKTYHLSNGMKVKAKDAVSYKAEAGTALGYSYLLSNGMTVQPYAKVSVAQELNRHNSTIVNNTEHFNNNMSGTTGWYGVGVNAQFSKQWSAYTEVNYGKGKHIESPFNGGIGVRYSF